MRHVIPVTALALAAAWIVAEALGSVALAVLVAGSAIPLAAATALRRRRGSDRRALGAGLTALAGGLTVGLGELAAARPSPPGALAAVLAAAVALGVLVPLLYAATLPRAGGGR